MATSRPAQLLKGWLVIGTLTLFCFFSPTSWATPSQALWNQSVEALENNRPEEACQGFKTWIEEQGNLEIRSAEAFFNLSLCSWQTKAFSQSVTFLLKSLSLRTSLSKRLSDLALLQKWQSELGIRENLAVRNQFILTHCFPENAITILLVLSVWTLLSALFFIPHRSGIKKSLISLSCCLALFGGAISAAKRLGGTVAVIMPSGDNAISVFDRAGKPRELISLPSGTLVELGITKNEWVQILKPIGGWIPSASVETPLP